MGGRRAWCDPRAGLLASVDGASADNDDDQRRRRSDRLGMSSLPRRNRFGNALVPYHPYSLISLSCKIAWRV